MKRTLVLSLVAVALASAQQLSATLLVDRGLPTANLNNAAGDDRSNVAWAFTQYTSGDYWLVGDTFQNTSSSWWTINTIRLWTVGRTDTAILRGGIDGSTIGIISDATYASPAPNDLYQGSSGSYITMHQVDFAVNITLAPGQVYDFFLDGSGAQTGIVVPFVHSSNAALSGSTQQGADNLMLGAEVINGVVDPLSVGTWTSLGNGWDKASDVNVQVFGTVPDAGATLGLLGFAVVGLGALRRKLSA
jgi:hypothetical protein